MTTYLSDISVTERAAARQLALTSIRNGSLLGLDEAIAWNSTLESANCSDPWPAIGERRNCWRRIEEEFGQGSLLNLDDPMINRLRERSSRDFHPHPIVFANAIKFRASTAWSQSLYHVEPTW